MKDRYVHRTGGSGGVLIIRLKPGSDLIRSISRIAEDEGIKAGVILSGVGLLREAHIRNCRELPEEYPITDKNRIFTKFDRPLEILALSGNISEVDGKPLVHAHIALSYVEDGKISVIGGHLLEGCIVFGFAEIFIMKLEGVRMIKSFDDETRTLQLFA